MDIGTKIKQARISANLTQEDIAEKLGVSRQTISSWENGKSYPDVTSLFTLSDVYNVTVDFLAKGDKEMINHLKESSNVRKSNKQIVLCVIALVIVNLAYFVGIIAIALPEVPYMTFNIVFAIAYIIIFAVFSYIGKGINRFFLGLGVFLLCNAFIITTLGGSTTHFFNPSILLTIFVPLLAILIITGNLRVFFSGLWVAVLPNEEITSEQCTKTVIVFRLLSKTAVIVAVISVLIGIINTGTHVDVTVETASAVFDTSIAIALLPLHFALILVVAIFEPAVHILKKRSSNDTN